MTNFYKIELSFYTDIRGFTETDLAEFAEIFTDFYPLVPYYRFRRNPEKWQSMFPKGIVDSGVYQLKKYGEYRYINEYPLADLAEGWLWVIPDYPHDMLTNWNGNECVSRTRENLEKWASFPNALPTFQFPMFDFAAFKRDFAAFNKQMAIGNLCRLFHDKNEKVLLRKILSFVSHNNPEKYRVHIFGCPTKGLRHLIRINPQFPISIDNTKWTKAFNRKLREIAFNANTNDVRVLFLREYLESIMGEVQETNCQGRLF